MFKYDDYIEEEMDSCDVCEAQMAYLTALGLTMACSKVGKQRATKDYYDDKDGIKAPKRRPLRRFFYSDENDLVCAVTPIYQVLFIVI